MSTMTAATKATNTVGKSPPPAETFRARKIQPPHDQALRGELQGKQPPAPHPGGGAGNHPARLSVRADPAPPDGGLTVAYFAATSTSLEAQASATSRLASAVPTLAQPPSSTASRCS